MEAFILMCADPGGEVYPEDVFTDGAKAVTARIDANGEEEGFETGPFYVAEVDSSLEPPGKSEADFRAGYRRCATEAAPSYCKAMRIIDAAWVEYRNGLDAPPATEEAGA